MTHYVELQVLTHFSLLRGASSPEELFAAAALLGYPALGISDLGTVAGVVRAWEAQKATNVRSIAGTRIDLSCGRRLLLYPTDRAAWSRITRLLTIGKRRAGKGACLLHWNDLEPWSEGVVAILLSHEANEDNLAALRDLKAVYGRRGYMALFQQRRPCDAVRIEALARQAGGMGVRAVVTGDVLYHAPEARLLQDVVTAVREKCTVDELGYRREVNADRALKPPEEMVRRFRAYPDALQASVDIARACTFDLGELAYQYPHERVIEGLSAQEALEKLAGEAVDRMFDGKVPDAYRNQIAHELRLIADLGYAPYFLTVHAIVREARRRGILCQGRGSAANSCVCFVLGVTSIDPVKHELLFERFVSGERREPPDIDVDFEHERREEIIQWIYETYGRDRSALTAVVTRYRARGAVRDVGKALGLPEDLTASLAGLVWGWSAEGVGEKQVDELNLDIGDRRLRLTLELARKLIGVPRHMSQHPGGFVLTHDRLDDLVPIEPAAMADRQIIEWDKDDIDALKFMKVDVLGLGMLGCMNRAFNMLEEDKGIRIGLADLQDDDPAVYAMIQKADTLGTFQIESRAQMSMLPRMKPRRFYDLVIQVAIVRPGPIQGDMVHPYLRRREGLERPEYPRPELRAVLEKTLGVPLFQEQAMKVAIVGAGFTPAEADALRRAMATFKFTGGVSHFSEKLIEGMVARGYPREFAERTFRQLEGFGSYGFPESHAASFAKISYASSWIKHHHPDVFCAALMNAQPMGFYAPAQIVRDAREHGVDVRPPCVNASRWDCTLETTGGRYLAVRLGLRVIRGLSNADGAKIVGARTTAPYESVEDVWRRSGAQRAAIEKLADGDAFHGFGADRRQGLWKVRGLGEAPLPLFAAADRMALTHSAEGNEPDVALRPLTDGREVIEDYRNLQLSLRAHPLSFVRDELTRRGVRRCADLAGIRDGRHVEVAGIILVRQKPGSAKGVLFITIEDETGIANGILWPDRFEAQRRTVMSASMVGLKGRVQKEGEVIHIICDRIIDHGDLLTTVGDMSFPHRTGRGDAAQHPGSPDRGDDGYKGGGWKPERRDCYWPPHADGMDPEQVMRFKSHDFH
ncbi:error-prone DNA polymerase [Sphingomonas carotinifaciens]|uniref:Error-prone DNA polymerase n=1 Tax=Sphingomonas carotinifaciens TaxID=1166323 RepID=A0A1G7PXM6_9SPHN|nr:error-prone DNA polymerase [Sphingomonas carotinifaciens]MBB4087553.1 error-prone DNA polymerase [Sphingomonas carotinifaciens]MWC45640.1 DNA polymerase III subunit alpha [Sphingomonas carotinifaciens]SDF90991.1 error-prone DNA polymerase, DnaE-like [Sphingomonas carotinifaciens]